MRDGFILVQHVAGVPWYYENAQNGKPPRMTNELDIRLIKFYKTKLRAEKQAAALGGPWKAIPFHD